MIIRQKSFEVNGLSLLYLRYSVVSLFDSPLRLRKYQRFHSENASNVFRPRYAGGISKTQQSPVILDLRVGFLNLGRDRFQSFLFR